MAETNEYQKLLTELIQKQMVIFGPNIALDKAKKVPGLTIDNNGSVLSISGEPQMVLKNVAAEYESLSPQIAKMTLGSLLEKYSTVKSS
ncbi:MAG TPA: hypothetical protein VE973_00005 [Candidatus Limnocylindria bacterium]|nr:hypothetical protein [Candidatus Limnocylindria bacterium]